MNLRDASRQRWDTPGGRAPCLEDITCGSLQRIADATERMAEPFVQLLAERDRLGKLVEDQQTIIHGDRERIAGRDRRIAALRGVITRMRRRVA